MQARAAVTMATASSASTSPPRITVKKELCPDNESIKELAETAMNDILGWYGYDSVDRLEMSASNVPSASTCASIERADSKPDNDSNLSPTVVGCSTSIGSSSGILLKAKRSEAKSCPQTTTTSRLVLQHSRGPTSLFTGPAHSDPLDRSAAPSTSRETPSTGIRQPGGSPPHDATAARNGIGLHHQAHPHHHHHHHPLPHHRNLGSGQGGAGSVAGDGPAAGGGGESSTSEKDSSRESSKSPMLMKTSLDKPEQTCQWCRKVIPSHQPGILGTTEGMIFCTEACFSQSRRASFKRAKTCDWCRHVRHAVSYVDFQDGASQLQFCSDKCLNQYKMQIFCNETQAHLELNPHLKEKSSSTGSLITPELWMKNCKSCSMSPTSDRSESVSPVPSIPVRSSPEPSPGALVIQASPTPVKKPLISVAPPSKLLSKSHQGAMSRTGLGKSSRKRRTAGHRGLLAGSQSAPSSKRPSAIQHQAEYMQTGGSNISTSSGSNASSSNNNNNNNNVTIPNNNLSVSSSGGVIQTPKPPPGTVLSSNVQDLRMLQKKPSPGTLGIDGCDGAGQLGQLPPPPPPPPNMNLPPQFLPPPLNLLRPPFFHMNAPHLRFGNVLANAQTLTQPTGPPPQMGPPPSPLPGVSLGNRPQLPNLLGMGAPPPVTILVPYPIIVPLPLPIPIPIPVIDFLRAALPKEPKGTGAAAPNDETESKLEEDEKAEEVETVMMPNEQNAREDDHEQQQEIDLDAPLDFTVASTGGSRTHDKTKPTIVLERWGEQADPSIVYTRPIVEESSTSYTLPPDMAGNDGNEQPPEKDSGLSLMMRESAQQAVPKIKISRLESDGGGVVMVPVEESACGVVTRRALDRLAYDEEELERERRKELVDRSRPLRKRKRLVVQQHLDTEATSEPTSDGVLDDPEVMEEK